MFKKVLIANRGENAVRIARTCERMGIATVAVHSEADKESLHVSICKEAFCIGPTDIELSYLNQEAVLLAAKKSGAQAIHPGNGLLSEQPSFAEKVEASGLVFIGPETEILEGLSNKLNIKNIALRAGLRVLEGTNAFSFDMKETDNSAENFGFPLVIKSAVRCTDVSHQSFQDLHHLKQALSNDGEKNRLIGREVYLERLIEKPRQIEVQIVADKNGTCVALGERECSLQHNNYKVIEESPAPVFSSMVTGHLKREMLWELAIQIAKEMNYRGLGTVKFIIDMENKFYFLGFVPRLQAEHSVTELCTSLDLIELQLRIAAGEKLPNSVLHAEPSGHSIEARIYAEDPDDDLRNCTGRIKELRWPTLAPGKFRIESGIAKKCNITSYDDPLIARVIAYSPTRHQAALILDRILAQTVIDPIKTNLTFLRSIIENQSFQAGQYDTTTCQK